MLLLVLWLLLGITTLITVTMVAILNVMGKRRERRVSTSFKVIVHSSFCHGKGKDRTLCSIILLCA